MQGQAGKAVSFHFVIREVVDILEPVESVIFAGRIVLPEFDLGAKDRGLRRHPVFHPPRGNEDNVRKLAHNLQIGLKPEFGVEKVVEVLDAQVSGDPWAIDDERHWNLVHLFAAHCSLECFPLFWQHIQTSWSPWGKRNRDHIRSGQPSNICASSTLQPFWPALRHPSQRYCSVVKLTSLHIT